MAQAQVKIKRMGEEESTTKAPEDKGEKDDEDDATDSDTPRALKDKSKKDQS